MPITECDSFSSYILPECQQSPKATEIEKPTFQNGSLHADDQIVTAVNNKGWSTNRVGIVHSTRNDEYLENEIGYSHRVLTFNISR